MTITPIVPDRPAPFPVLPPLAPIGTAAVPAVAPAGDAASAFARAVDAAGTVFDRADRAESAFAHGRGGLQEMVIERARADVALSIASTAASRTAQAVSTVMGMQI